MQENGEKNIDGGGFRSSKDKKTEKEERCSTLSIRIVIKH